jgi:hypothetical protein
MISMPEWKIRVNDSGNVYGPYTLEEIVTHGFASKHFQWNLEVEKRHAKGKDLSFAFIEWTGFIGRSGEKLYMWDIVSEGQYEPEFRIARDELVGWVVLRSKDGVVDQSNTQRVPLRDFSIREQKMYYEDGILTSLCLLHDGSRFLLEETQAYMRSMEGKNEQR